jgi:hypothetical protein
LLVQHGPLILGILFSRGESYEMLYRVRTIGLYHIHCDTISLVVQSMTSGLQVIVGFNHLRQMTSLRSAETIHLRRRDCLSYPILPPNCKIVGIFMLVARLRMLVVPGIGDWPSGAAGPSRELYINLDLLRISS